MLKQKRKIIYMILFRYRISDKNDIDESINIDELIVKSRK